MHAYIGLFLQRLQILKDDKKNDKDEVLIGDRMGILVDRQLKRLL